MIPKAFSVKCGMRPKDLLRKRERENYKHLSYPKIERIKTDSVFHIKIQGRELKEKAKKRRTIN